MLVVGSIAAEVWRRSAGLTLDVSAWIVEGYFGFILVVEISLVCVHVVQDSRTRVVDLFLIWKVLVESIDWSCIQVSVELIVCDFLPDLLSETRLIILCLLD